MSLRFVHKTFAKRPEKPIVEETAIETNDVEQTPKNKRKNTKNMTTMEKVVAAEAVVENLEPSVKVLKKDRGLIERTESSKIILTEDNREVLTD
jgi:hypothetical protein